MAAVVGGQMVASLLLDQYGLVGFPVHPVSVVRLLGAGLVIGGVVLVQR
jgi:transporter family-2 protein